MVTCRIFRFTDSKWPDICVVMPEIKSLQGCPNTAQLHKLLVRGIHADLPCVSFSLLDEICEY